MNVFHNCKVVGAGVDPQQYHADLGERGTISYCMTRGQLLEFNVCPMRWRSGYKPDVSDQMHWGDLLDQAVLSPTRFATQNVMEPETYPAPSTHAKVKAGDIDEGDPLPWNNNATFCKNWHDMHADKNVIKSQTARNIEGAIARLHGDPQIHDLLTSSQTQVLVTGEYADDETGITIPVKCLIDILPKKTHPFFGKTLADLKTTSSCDQRLFAKSIFTWGWHVQAAWYLDMYVGATQEERVNFMIAAQENYEPWVTGRRILSNEFIEIGRHTYMRALERYCRCLKTNEWPDYEVEDRAINSWTIAEPEPWMVNA